MRILVTRPAHDASRTAARLAGLGHEAICAPILSIVPTRIPPPVTRYDILIVTSANGAGRLPALPGWETKTVYAVGPRTAEAIREQGSPGDLRIADGDALSILAMMETEPPKGTILHLTGVNHKAEPDATLRARGFQVHTWSAYDAVAARQLPATLATALSEKRLDAALHYSRRSVETLLDLIDSSDMKDSFIGIAHFCLSEDVARPLRIHDAGQVLVAEEPSESSLLRLLPRL